METLTNKDIKALKQLIVNIEMEITRRCYSQCRDREVWKEQQNDKRLIVLKKVLKYAESSS